MKVQSTYGLVDIVFPRIGAGRQIDRAEIAIARSYDTLPADPGGLCRIPNYPWRFMI